MPYKSSGVWVLVFKNGRWVRLRRMPTVAAAKAHASALNIATAGKHR